MSLLSKLKEAFSRTGHISKLDKAFEEQDINFPVGIQMHHAGLDGIDEDRIVIREYRNGTSGDVILNVEWKPIDNNWVLLEGRTKSLVTTVEGEENYNKLAEEIEKYLMQQANNQL